MAIAVIAGAGICAQWLASSLGLPSVLILLPTGIIVGPVTGLVDARALFGDALFPVIAIAVGLILFEGGSGLQLKEARSVGRPVLGLVTVGVVVTGAVISGAAYLLFDVSRSVALLLGTILIVSGPTVVLPLLETVHLRDPIRSILRWECIVIDPIGAVIAVGVFEVVVKSDANHSLIGILATSAGVGVGVGVAAGLGLAAILRYHLVPDRLHNPLTLAMVIGCFVVADVLSVQAGLFATTVMGAVLVNQRLTPVAHITAFGEDVFILLLGGLFVVIGATIDIHALGPVILPSLALLAVVVLVRPVAVWLATLGSGLRWNDRLYLSLIAPRGVVAASVSALFAVSLGERGIGGASQLAPIVFCVIIGSVVIASVVAGPASRWLRVADAERVGVVLVGDDRWLLDTATELAANEVPVLYVPLLADSAEAAERGLLTYVGSVDGDEFAEAVEAIGACVAVVSVDPGHAAPLVASLSELLGRKHVFLTAVPDADGADRPTRSRAWGRVAFAGLHRLTGEGDSSPIITTVAASEVTGDKSLHVPLFVLRDDQPPSVAVSNRVKATAGRAVVATPSV